MSTKESPEARIIEAARELFLRDGFKGARLQEIAERAGVNKALLHYYFRSKEKLYDAIFAPSGADLTLWVKILNDETKTIPEKLEAFAAEMLSVASAHASEFQMQLTALEAEKHQESDSIGKSQLILNQLHFAKQLADAQALGLLKAGDPALWVYLLLSLSLLPILRPSLQTVTLPGTARDAFLSAYYQQVPHWFMALIRA